MLGIIECYYRVFQVNFECAHNNSPPPIGFSTAVKWYICFVRKFQNLHMSFTHYKELLNSIQLETLGEEGWAEGATATTTWPRMEEGEGGTNQ